MPVMADIPAGNAANRAWFQLMVL